MAVRLNISPFAHLGNSYQIRVIAVDTLIRTKEFGKNVVDE
jgi:hypothetical protein